MPLKFAYYVPTYAKDSDETKQNILLLDKTKIPYEIKCFESGSKEEEKIKSNALLSISVCGRIKIKQTRRTKCLYPHLVIFDGNEPIIFYPQERTNESITINGFLKELLNGKIKSLHSESKIEELFKKAVER